MVEVYFNFNNQVHYTNFDLNCLLICQINLSQLSLRGEVFTMKSPQKHKGWIDLPLIGPLHDPVTWYGINYTGMQIMQWDFQNKGKSGWTGVSSFVWKSHYVICVPV